jgi:hypothetical protein
MGLFSIFCMRARLGDARYAQMQSPLPGTEEGFVTAPEDRDAQVFFSIGQTLFSSGMNASVAGMVATRL